MNAPETIPCSAARIERLLHPTLGIMRGLKECPPDKLVTVKVRELREITDTLVLAAKESEALRNALTASVDRSPEGQDPQGLGAKHESAVGAPSAETPNP